MISYGLPRNDVLQIVCDSEDELPETVPNGTIAKVVSEGSEGAYVFWGGAWNVVNGGSGQGDVPVDMMLFDVSSGTHAVLIGISDDYEVPADGYEIVVPTTYQGLPVKGAGGADMETQTSAFVGCTSFSSESIETLDVGTFAGTELASVSLPSATTIGQGAFYGCTALTTISLPEATTIGNVAFGDCTSLASVSLPAATDIGESAFYGCTALASISLPATAIIGGNVFEGCESLASVSLPAATTIGNSAFRGCTSLASVSLPAATTIYISGFSNCSSLASVSLPSATNILGNVFEGCSAIEHVEFGPLTSVSSQSFRDWIFYDTDGTTVLDKTVAANLAGYTFEGTARALVKQA